MIIYTCVFGYTDELQEPEFCSGHEFVCFTDQPITSKRWNVVKLPTQDKPTRAARMLKALPHRLFPDATHTLWMDANFTLMANPSALIAHGDYVTFRHPERKRISDEWREIARLGKARKEDLQRQLVAYHADGFDTDSNPMQELTCAGVILRRHTPKVIETCELLAKQLQEYTLRDQMATDYCAWKTGLKLSRWPGIHRDNPYFKFKHFTRPTNDF